uniref:Uncharacterized protein n=1 Tax=Salarias fasciatus TaxID=181472 RepID=A0A672FXV2_SALFA
SRRCFSVGFVVESGREGSANLLMPHVCCINASNQVLKFIKLFTVRICAASPLTLVSLINTHTHTNTHKIVVLLTVNNDQEHIKISRISLPGCAPGRTPSYTDPSSPCSFDSGTAGSTGKSGGLETTTFTSPHLPTLSRLIPLPQCVQVRLSVLSVSVCL